MYKITIKEIVGELETITILETDDIELVKEVLVSKEILKVETDVPNQSVDPDWEMLQRIWREALQLLTKPLAPYRTPSGPGDWPYTSPFTVTC